MNAALFTKSIASSSVVPGTIFTSEKISHAMIFFRPCQRSISVSIQLNHNFWVGESEINNSAGVLAGPPFISLKGFDPQVEYPFPLFQSYHALNVGMTYISLRAAFSKMSSHFLAQNSSTSPVFEYPIPRLSS